MTRFKTTLRIAIGIIFLLASFDKLQHPEAFARIVENYRILPDILIAPVAIILPWVEFICGISMVFNVMSCGAALILSTLMIIFLTALGFNAYRGLDVACGCFTTEPSSGGNALWYILRDVAIGLASLISLGTLVLEQRKNR